LEVVMPSVSFRRRFREAIVPACLSLVLFATTTARAGEFTIALDEGEGDKAVAAGEPKLEGKVVKAKWVDGKNGKALQFNDFGNELVKPKASDATFVAFDNHDALVPKEKIAITVQVWLDRENPFYYGGIVEKGQGFGAAYRLGVLRNRKLRASVGNKLLSVDSPEPLAVGAWHEVQMVFDGKRLALSIDGKEVAAKDGTVEKFDNKDPLLLGTRLTGKIDDLKITVD